MKKKLLWIAPVVIVWTAAAAWVLLRAVPSWQAKEACLAGGGVWDMKAQSCQYPPAPTPSAAPAPVAQPPVPSLPADSGAPIRHNP